MGIGKLSKSQDVFIMKKLIFVYISIFCVVLSMISSKKNYIEMTIAGRNHRYWLKKSHVTKSQVYYYFDRQGQWYVYARAYKASALTKYDGGDIMLNESKLNLLIRTEGKAKDVGYTMGMSFVKIRDGQVQHNRYNRTKLENNKYKVNYHE